MQPVHLMTRDWQTLNGIKRRAGPGPASILQEAGRINVEHVRGRSTLPQDKPPVPVASIQRLMSLYRSDHPTSPRAAGEPGVLGGGRPFLREGGIQTLFLTAYCIRGWESFTKVKRQLMERFA